MSGVDIAFWILAAGTVAFSAVVVTNRNPVACVLFLVASFFCLAGLFVTLHSHFLAAIQVLIYAGAIMVLFLFVIMLLNLGTPQWFDVSSPALRIVVLLLGTGFVAALISGGLPEFEPAVRGPVADVPADVRGSTEAVGAVLYTVYYLPFMATALLLLLAMVGAVVLARRER
ncbi:MAG TPA: NADH-quinone oxidoreductase subunit J [Gemmatimonadota bacterium]|nr:NADH-quinone oxidoreductase subunit J [Gemmatimonadota bacterium]